jgi:hypothetical protein|nr:MAG TPA: hypothetical protein [Caudoviricetes sp.]
MEIILTAKDLEEVQYINGMLNPTDYPPGVGFIHPGVMGAIDYRWSALGRADLDDLPEGCLSVVLAVVAFTKLVQLDGDGVIEYVTYVKSGRTVDVLKPLDLPSPCPLDCDQLKGRLLSFINRFTTPTRVGEQVEVVLREEDLRQVAFISGVGFTNAMHLADECTGFSINLAGGGSKIYEIPEFLQDLVYRLGAEQKTLAAAALVEQKLSDFYDGAVVKNISIDAPEMGLEDVSLLAMWHFIGVTRPVTVGQLRVFLRRFIGLYTNLLLPARGGVPQLNSGKGRLVLRDEDLERVKFQALDIPHPFSTGGTRIRANLGFTLNGKEYTPKDGEACQEIFWGPYEDRFHAILALIADLAEERNIPREIDLDFKAFEVYAGLVSKVMDEVKGKNRDSLRKTLAHHWNIIDKKDRPTSRVVLYDKDLESVSFRNFSIPRPFYGFGTHSQEDLGFTIGSRMFIIKDEEASEDVYYGPMEDRFDALLVLAHEKAKADGVQYPIDVVVAAKGEVISSELISNVNAFLRDNNQEGVEQYLRETWEVVDVEA